MTRRTGWALSLVLALMWVHAAVCAQEEPPEDIFFKANQAYQEDRFQDAAAGYLQLMESGMNNGHIYYNLGNACLRLNDLGRAILYYERARRLMPRDADLNFNLRYAKDQTRDAVPASESLVSQSFFWLDDLTLPEVFCFFAVLNAAFFLILSLRLFLRPEWTYYLLLILLIFNLVAAASFGLKWHQSATDDRAVVLAGAVDVLAGPDVQDTVLFKLHEGALIHSERTEDGWVLVRLSEEKRGWVQAEYVERVVPDHALMTF